MLVEESAALTDSDVKELIGLSKSAVQDGATSKSEINDLLKTARAATQESCMIQQETTDISEAEIAALLDQLNKESATPEGTPLNAEEEHPESETGHVCTEKSTDPDDSAQVAAILSQLIDTSRLEDKFGETEPESPSPSVSIPHFPSVPKDSDSVDDDLFSRLAKLKTISPKTYTGTDRGSINVFIPGISTIDNDDTIHWCGASRISLSTNLKSFAVTTQRSSV